MNIHELMQPISTLSHADKFRLVQLLIEQIAREEGVEFPEKNVPERIFDPRAYYGAGHRTNEEIESHLSEVREGWN